MAPNRIRSRASSNPATRHQGLPRRHGHRTLPELPKSPGSGLPACRLIPVAAIPFSCFVTRPSNVMAGSTMMTCAYPARVPLLDCLAYVA
jgi:hypothetical protein